MKTITTIYSLLAFSLAGTFTFGQMTKTIQSGRGMVLSNVRGFQLAHPSSIMDIRSTNKGVLFPRMTTTDRDAIGSPQAGLLVYNTSTNQFNFYNGAAWQTTSSDKQWGVNGSVLYHSGQVGIGTSNMINSNTFLTVRGNLGGDNLEGMYVDAISSTGKPFYGYSVNDSSKVYHYVDGATSRWALSIGGSDKLSVTSEGNLKAMGNTEVAGTLTVNHGNGIISNAHGNSQLKYYTFQVTYNVNLGANGTSAEKTITLPEGVFNSAPVVTVGNIVATNGATGTRYRVLLSVYDCTATSCHARLLNTNSNAVNYETTWNIVCIGN